MGSSPYKLTYICAVSAVVVFVTFTLLLATYYTYCIDEGMEILNLDESETKRLATALFFSKLESIGNISLALIGILWIFRISMGYKIRIYNTAQEIIFIMINLFLLGSFVAYFLGYDLLLGRMFFHSTIDLEAPIVKFWMWAQRGYLFLGVMLLVVFIYLCHENNESEIPSSN